MTVPVDVSQVSYVGNAVTTAFSTVFGFLANADVLVEKKLSGGTSFTTQTEGVDYSLIGAGNAGAGTVTFLIAAPATGDTVRITRNTPILQPTAFRAQGTFVPALHEQSFDRATMWGEDLERRIAALEAGGTPVSLTASVVTDTFVVADPVESNFPRNVACAGTPKEIIVARVEDLTAGSTIHYGLGTVDWGSPVLNQFTVKFLPGLVPGDNTRVTFLVLTV